MREASTEFVVMSEAVQQEQRFRFKVGGGMHVQAVITQRRFYVDDPAKQEHRFEFDLSAQDTKRLGLILLSMAAVLEAKP
jgi:hypothetical protein